MLSTLVVFKLVFKCSFMMNLPYHLKNLFPLTRKTLTLKKDIILQHPQEMCYYLALRRQRPTRWLNCNALEPLIHPAHLATQQTPSPRPLHNVIFQTPFTTVVLARSMQIHFLALERKLAYLHVRSRICLLRIIYLLYAWWNGLFGRALCMNDSNINLHLQNSQNICMVWNTYVPVA